MTEPSSIEKTSSPAPTGLVQVTPVAPASTTRPAIADLHHFFDDGKPLGERDAPARTRELATSLFQALSGGPGDGSASLQHRIVTDAFLRSEADRDQNVYLGRFFTRSLTRAVPDVIFQPVDAAEAARSLAWARERGVPVTLRGAASTAMGGAVPNDGGLTLDLSRLDAIEIDAQDGVAVIGAGARLRVVHQRLADRGLALRNYPSNLGGTLAGWFVTGGVGMNAFGRGRALDSMRAADVLLPSGEHVRFHHDGRLDVVDRGQHRHLAAAETAAWFRGKNLEPMTLADLAGSEGVFGLVLQLTVAVERRPEIGAFLLAFERRDDALQAIEWVSRMVGQRFGAPGNVKLLSASHLHHVRRVWQDEDARAWRARPGALSAGATLPWTRIAGPADYGVATAPDLEHAGAYLFVDFLDPATARAFAGSLAGCPGSPRVLGDDSVRFAAERFKPQQTKRLGPGLLAAEILMPAREVPAFLPRAEALAANVGRELDAEVYYLADGQALVIGGYLTDHRTAAYLVDLVLAPALLDLAMTRHRAMPYVLGRWQSAWLERRFGAAGASRMRAAKRALDPHGLVNAGVATGFKLRGVAGALLAATFVPGMSLARAVFETPALGGLVRAARGVLAGFPGPAHGRGAPAVVGATWRAPSPATIGPAAASALATSEQSVLLAIAPGSAPAAPAQATQPAEDRALHCVNCGECNSVCPIFHESAIRLPQMLTHLGESMKGGATLPETASVLLDLCMRCGNCEEVCQAGIPHLPLYSIMQGASDHARPPAPERHAAIVAAVRGSSRYTRDFLHVRPGAYQKRSPASLPGVGRYVLMRSENDAGPAATCIHCGACVAVCPTHANREFEGADPRWITTVQNRCIGCGTCVEVCPANQANGGQTLRVVEAPTADWFAAIGEYEAKEGRAPIVSQE